MTRKKNFERGGDLLEVSLILVPLLGILFLLLDISMVVFLRSTFQHSVREGVRYGITGANDTGPCQDDSIKKIVKTSAIGFLNKSGPAATLHVHFMSPVDGSKTDNQPGNIIEVSIEGYKYNVLAPFHYSGSPYLWARAFDVVEPYTGAPPCLSVSE